MIEIRSFRRVFDLERRIYSVDRFRLNPAGVPVRGVLYCVALIVLALGASATPLAGALLSALPWYIRDVIGPVAVAAGLSVVRVEGRTFHLAASGMLGLLCAPRRLSGLTRPARAGERWVMPELLMLPDGSDARLRRLSYAGPGAVSVQVEHRRAGVREQGRVGVARRQVTLRLQGPARGRRLAKGQVIALEQGARIIVEPTMEPGG